MRVGCLQAFLHLLEQVFDLALDLLLENWAHLRRTEAFHLHAQETGRDEQIPPPHTHTLLANNTLQTPSHLLNQSLMEPSQAKRPPVLPEELRLGQTQTLYLTLENVTSSYTFDL